MQRKMIWGLATAMFAFGGLAACGEEADPNPTPTPTTGKIAGTVTGSADGAALAGVGVSVDGVATATTGADGKYTLELAPGTYKVAVALAGYVAKERADVVVEAGGAVTLDFALDVAMGKIVGLVTGAADGKALAGARVATDSGAAGVTTDADGKYAIDLAPGTYKVTVTLDAYLAKERADVVVAPGATVVVDLSLELATGGAKLLVRDLCAGAGLVGATLSRDGAADLTTGADGSATAEGLLPGEYTFAVAAAGFLPGEATLTVVVGATAEATVELLCQRKAAGDVARAFLSTATSSTAVTTAKVLNDKRNDADPNNDPTVISVRAAADYEKGHIPGAINIPWKTVADEASLALLGNPLVAGYVNYCYTGHTGGIAGAVLNLLGYKTANLKYGIVSWTRDATARGPLATPPDQTKDFPFETAVNTTTATYELPWMAYAGAKTAADVLKAAARAYLGNASMKPTINAQELFDNLNDGNTTNDPFIISVRAAADYAKGHIPGAINIPWNLIALEENLRKIPTDREVVIYCYTGHTGGIATGVLGTLGYHKVKNLKYGMLGWTQDPVVRVQAAFNDLTDSNDFAINTGVNP